MANSINPRSATSTDPCSRTAFHEAGHALVALATPGASPIHKATIVPRGHALGMVTQVRRRRRGDCASDEPTKVGPDEGGAAWPGG